MTRKARREIDDRRVAPRKHAALRRQDEVVEGAAADEIERLQAYGFVDPWKCRHDFILQAYWNSRVATPD